MGVRATDALPRGVCRRLVTAALCLVVAAGAAAVPAVGEVASGSLGVGSGRKIPLPPGTYRVHAAQEDTVPTSSEAGIGQGAQRIQLLTLASVDPLADIPLIVLDYSVGARVNWNGQPCDTPDRQISALLTQTFGTTTSSVVVKCQRIYATGNLRGAVRSAEAASVDWIRKRFASVATLHQQVPVNGIMVHGFLSKAGGDRINYWLYLNPGHFGLDDAEGRPNLFRTLERSDERSRQGKIYLKAVSEWSEAYLDHVQSYFLSSRFGSATVEPLAFAGLRRTTEPVVAQAAAPAPVPTAASAASVVAQSPAPLAPVKLPPTQAPPPAEPAAPRAQSVHALVIGNAGYPAARLANARNDANAIGESFRRFGFTVTVLLDATRQQFVQSLAQFSASARGADVGIVFYAGHGMQVGGVNYLIPIDLDLSGNRDVSVPLEAVSLDTILQEHLPGRTRLVFLDACRDNPLARSLAGTRGTGIGLAPVQAATGTLISYATRDGGTALDGTAGNSPYTGGLLAHLGAPDDIALVLRRVRQHVLRNTNGRQEPWEYGSLVGDTLILSRVAQRP